LQFGFIEANSYDSNEFLNACSNNGTSWSGKDGWLIVQGGEYSCFEVFTKRHKTSPQSADFDTILSKTRKLASGSLKVRESRDIRSHSLNT